MQPKILLVDDREDNMLSIEAILDPDGYRFTRANSGRQALKILLQETDFALILMDVKMPNLNGFETASLIYEREKLKSIPIIFITAHNYGDENIFMGYRAGAVDYIYKPINPELLRAKVGVFIDLYMKNHKLIIQEQRLTAINRSLESEIAERKASEQQVKELNQQLLENIDRLESANKDLDTVAFMASHDLQEPLRKILTFGERLQTKYNGLLDDEGKRYMQRIQKAATRMQALINDIMTFSKISGKKEGFVQSDLNALLNEVITEMDGPLKERKAKIQIMDALPVLYANPVLIRPLFYNLLSNAIKYSKQNEEPFIKISAEQGIVLHDSRRDVKNTYCRIYIEDNGIGFEQKYSEQIFGMFKRLHNHDQYEGTGIGLALCKKIVEEHSGYISAKSQVDVGSTFIISLPVNFNPKPESNELVNDGPVPLPS